jgi:hypothetical protein
VRFHSNISRINRLQNQSFFFVEERQQFQQLACKTNGQSEEPRESAEPRQLLGAAPIAARSLSVGPVIMSFMAKAAQKSASSQGARVSEAELRELREIEARVKAGTEPIVDGQVVMLQTMRSLVKASKRKRA